MRPVIAVRPWDEHGRILWRDNEIPEVGSGFGIWRGLVVTPDMPYGGNSVSGCHDARPYAVCTNGWVRSGDWWLHCTTCHPYTEEQDIAMKCRRGFHRGCGCVRDEEQS